VTHVFPPGRIVQTDTNIGRSVVASWDFYGQSETSDGDAFLETTGGRLAGLDGDGDLQWFVDAGSDPVPRYGEVLVASDQGVEHASPRTTQRFDFRGANLDLGRSIEFIFRTASAWSGDANIAFQFAQATDLWRFGFNAGDFYFLVLEDDYDFAAIGNASGGPPIDNAADVTQHLVGTWDYSRNTLDFYYQGGLCGIDTWTSPLMPVGSEQPRGCEFPVDGHTNSLGLIAMRVYDRALTQPEISLLANNYQYVLHEDEDDEFVPLFAAAGAAPQTLTPGAYASTTTISAPTVTNAAQDVQPGVNATTTTFSAPTVSPGAVDLTPGALASTTSFPAASVAVGPVTLTPGLFGSTTSFPVPAVSTGAVDLAPGLVDSTTTFDASTITVGPVTLTPGLFDSTTTFDAIIVTPGAVDLTPGLMSTTTSIFAPTITSGLQLFAPVIASTTSFPSATLAPGPVDLGPSLQITSTVFPAPTVAPGAVDLAPGALASTTSFFSPTLDQLTVLTPALYASTTTFSASVVTTGGVTLTAPLLATTTTFYAPTVIAGIVLGAAITVSGLPSNNLISLGVAVDSIIGGNTEG